MKPQRNECMPYLSYPIVNLVCHIPDILCKKKKNQSRISQVSTPKIAGYYLFHRDPLETPAAAWLLFVPLHQWMLIKQYGWVQARQTNG